MSYEPMRRVAWVLLFYGLSAWVVVQGGGLLRRVLALPPLFETLLHGALVLGVPLAVLIAWRFPEVGGHPPHGAPSDAPRGKREQG